LHVGLCGEDGHVADPDQLLVLADEHADRVAFRRCDGHELLLVEADGIRACTRNPPCGNGPACRSPPTTRTRSRSPARPRPPVDDTGPAGDVVLGITAGAPPGAPDPCVITSISRRSSPCRRRTAVGRPAACLSALVSDSCTTRYAASSTASGKGRGSPSCTHSIG